MYIYISIFICIWIISIISKCISIYLYLSVLKLLRRSTKSTLLSCDEERVEAAPFAGAAAAPADGRMPEPKIRQLNLRQGRTANPRCERMLMICLPPQGTPPNTAADMAHSTHSTQPALRPHRAAPRAEDKLPQTRRPHSSGQCSPLSEGADPGKATRKHAACPPPPPRRTRPALKVPCSY